MKTAIIAITFFGVLLIYYDIYFLMSYHKLTIRRRVLDLARLRSGKLPLATDSLPAGEDAPDTASRRRPLARLEEMLERRLSRYNAAQTISEKLRQADLHLRPSEFMSLQAGTAIAGAALGLWLTHNPVLAVVFCAIGDILPLAYLNIRKERRLKAFNNQLPDALNIISNALKSGYSFLQALDMASTEMPGPIAQEFAQVVRECRVNVPVEGALDNLAKRVGSRDLELAVTAIAIQRQVGGNLAEILDNINQTIRDRMRILGEVRTLTAQGKISGFVISLLPAVLALLLYTINPGYMRPLFTTTLGHLMLALAVALEIIGIAAIRRMVNIEV